MDHLRRRLPDGGLEKDNVEHIVDASTRRQRQSVRQRTNALLHPKRTVEPWRQLAGGLVCYASRQALVQTQPHPIADHELDVAVVVVVLSAHELLSVQEALLDVDEEGVAVLQLLVHREHLGEPRFVGHQGRRLPAIHHVERHHLEGRLE
jgi:hypothetical protein